MIFPNTRIAVNRDWNSYAWFMRMHHQVQGNVCHKFILYKHLTIMLKAFVISKYSFHLLYITKFLRLGQLIVISKRQVKILKALCSKYLANIITV